MNDILRYSRNSSSDVTLYNYETANGMGVAATVRQHPGDPRWWAEFTTKFVTTEHRTREAAEKWVESKLGI